ncbi:MAG: hypothetical protein PHO14_03115 [Kiritimatiellae bacterium]|nr:hypothetical protein [Kiritimatiellia bacterium]MDD4341205.1 hypothetical protein [Kiritimatiellia bacterium]
MIRARIMLHMLPDAYNGKFPPTQWDLVAAAAEPSQSNQRMCRMDELLKLYMTPLLAHLVLAKGIQRHQAEDLLQGFFTTKILKSGFLSRANKSRGKFRSFLLTSLNNYVVSEFRKSQTRRRAPGIQPLLSLEALAEQVEQKAISAGSMAFDLAWVREVIMEALKRVKSECLASKRRTYWVLFEDRVVKPTLYGATPNPYGVMVERLGFSSPIQAANAVFTVKRIFQRNFRAVIAEYAGNHKNVEHEINELYAILASQMT